MVQNLHTLIRNLAETHGSHVVARTQMVNMLDDLRVFRNDTNGTKYVLKRIIRQGYADKLLAQPLESPKFVQMNILLLEQKIAKTGLNPAVVRHALAAIAFGASTLNWNDIYQQAPESGIFDNVNPENTEIEVNGCKFTMIAVEGGDFVMGATTEQGFDACYDEKPATRFSIKSFKIAQTAVSQELYSAVTGNNPSHHVQPDCPVERVTLHEAKEFINKLNAITGHHFRLPTEVEWEYAARGGKLSKSHKFAGTDAHSLNDFCWHKENSGGVTHPVTSLNPNELGIYHMSGNVLEWTDTVYTGSLANLLLPKTQFSGIVQQSARGGSYNDPARQCRVSQRKYANPDYRTPNIGFRIAESVNS